MYDTKQYLKDLSEDKKEEAENKLPLGKLKIENGYSLYKVIEALSKILDEVVIVISNEGMQINSMDASRISLLQLKVSMYSMDIFDFEKYGKVGINLEDLEKILKNNKKDNKEIILEFIEKSKLKIIKESKLSTVTKTLAYLDIDVEDVPMENLKAIDYPTSFEISNELLADMFREAGIYSDIIGIEVEEGGVHFKESGVIGESDSFYDNDKLHDITYEEYAKGSHSLGFLSIIKKFLDIMRKGDIVKFSMKTDHPLKISINFKEIDGEILYFIAPRVEEAEYDDDDDDDW